MSKTQNQISLKAAILGMHQMERLRPLLDYKEEERDMEWLELALQSAVSVEFSTIPPYLCALWSIKNDTDPVAKTIRNVVQEEMLHMSLACNMLTAIGCVPKISDPDMVPSYPGKLPGGIHQDLNVSLSGLTDDSLDVFIAIEAPPVKVDPDKTNSSENTDVSIGAFYDAILDTFKHLKPDLSPDRQITGPLAYMVMEDLNSVEAAINLIKDQGEGSEASPEVENTNELAHYYRFKEVRYSARLRFVDGQDFYDGDKLERPETWPMAVIPPGGYLQENVSTEVWDLVSSTDQLYTEMLDRLQAVWEYGNQGAMVHAIETMFELSEKARSLMSIQKKPGSNYGPSFRYIEKRRKKV